MNRKRLYCGVVPGKGTGFVLSNNMKRVAELLGVTLYFVRRYWAIHWLTGGTGPIVTKYKDDVIYYGRYVEGDES